MPTDLVVDEIRRIREKLAEESGFDIHRIVAASQARAIGRGMRLVSRPQRIPFSDLPEVGRIETNTPSSDGT